jgi:hypothetical protein
MVVVEKERLQSEDHDEPDTGLSFAEADSAIGQHLGENQIPFSGQEGAIIPI